MLLCAFLGASRSVPIDERERIAIRKAMAAGTCTGTDEIGLKMGFTEAEDAYTYRCQRAAQSRILSRATAKGDCSSVMRIPGRYPFPDMPSEQKRFVYHCWLKAGKADLDSCLEISEVGNETSASLIEAALRRNPPVSMPSGHLGLYDTNMACSSALMKLRKISDAQFLAVVGRWGGAWADWAQDQRSGKLVGH